MATRITCLSNCLSLYVRLHKLSHKFGFELGASIRGDTRSPALQHYERLDKGICLLHT